MDVKKNKQNTLWEKIKLNSFYGFPPSSNSFKFFDSEEYERVMEFARAFRINFERQEKLKIILGDNE